MGVLEVSEFWILSQLLVILSQSQPELEVFLEIILPFVAPFSLLSGSINFSWMGILKTLRIPRAQMLGEGYTCHYCLSDWSSVSLTSLFQSRLLQSSSFLQVFPLLIWYHLLVLQFRTSSSILQSSDHQPLHLSLSHRMLCSKFLLLYPNKFLFFISFLGH